MTARAVSWHVRLPGRVLLQWGVAASVAPPYCRFLVRVERPNPSEGT